MPKKNNPASKEEVQTLVALATNDTKVAAAQSLGISKQALFKRIHKYGLTDKLDTLRTAAQEELLVGASKAARNLISKIESQDENISIKASTETLDRIGLTKIDQKGATPNIQFNQIQINQREKYDL